MRGFYALISITRLHDDAGLFRGKGEGLPHAGATISGYPIP